MIQRFKDNCTRLGVKEDSKILLAVSGGKDSMCMLHLARQTFSNIAVAHVNFKLRGKESDEDQNFVASYCYKSRVKYFDASFETDTYAAKNKFGIQEAARELRYKWFEELRQKEGYDFVFTAHHQNDVIETFLINLARGAGARGLASIPAINGSLRRPLLIFSSEDITDYRYQYQIPHREDSSNNSDKYLRNAIRHNVIPLLEEVFPNFTTGVAKSIKHLAGLNTFMESLAADFRDLYFTKNGEEEHIAISALEKVEGNSPLWFYIFRNYGLNAEQLAATKDLLQNQSGKVIETGNYRIIRDREVLIILKVSTEEARREWEITSSEGYLETSNFQLFWKVPSGFSEDMFGINKACIPLSKLTFPLTLRNWKEGDKFSPLGMNGIKKISDFLIDNKVSLSQKEKVFVLTNGGDICWVAGMRLSEKYKLQNSAEPFVLFEFMLKND